VGDIPCSDYEWPTAYVSNGDEGDEHVASVAQTSDDWLLAEPSDVDEELTMIGHFRIETFDIFTESIQ